MNGRGITNTAGILLLVAVATILSAGLFATAPAELLEGPPDARFSISDDGAGGVDIQYISGPELEPQNVLITIDGQTAGVYPCHTVYPGCREAGVVNTSPGQRIAVVYSTNGESYVLAEHTVRSG
jgi:hypothetical protein